MNEILIEEIANSLCNVKEHFKQNKPTEELVGLGLMCDDEVKKFATYFLFRSMVGESPEPDYRFNPMDWDNNLRGECLTELNEKLVNLSSSFSNEQFPIYIRTVFDSCIKAIKRVKLLEGYSDDFFITMGGVDPIELLEKEEYRFVKLANNSSVYEKWLKDYA